MSAAIDGQNVIDLLQNESSDRMICEIDMPEMNCYQVFKFVKSKTETTIIPFVFVELSTQKNEIEKGGLASVNSYLSKPLHEEVLLEIIVGLLG